MRKNKYWDKLKVVWPLLALLLIGGILFMERTGIVLEAVDVDNGFSEKQERTPQVYQAVDCLLVYQEKNPVSVDFADQMQTVLKGMKVPYELLDVGELGEVNLSAYKKMIYALTDLDAAGENVMKIARWVEQGGVFMNTATFDINASFDLMAGKMGILEGGDNYRNIDGFRVSEGFMIGAEREAFLFDAPTFSNMEVLLKPEAEVYIQASDSELPLLWTMDYGEGKFIIMNQTLTGKVSRGILTAAYSLSDDISSYPVINASALYLDDFPAPVPAGNAEYVWEQYGMDISNFYANIWWKDILEFGEKYGLLYTGLIIEQYSDVVEPPFEPQTSEERFSYFGSMLLNEGGELGFHGYNHMPLCLVGFGYTSPYDSYNLWQSEEDIKVALQELQRFSKELFPEEEFVIYVPPSNVLSAKGRRILLETWPQIRAIASTYLEGNVIYEQEFEVAEDGVVETPRITSGTIFEEYSYMMAFSELNFHFVQSHFIHPDDVLDAERGAEYGWENMKQSLDDYFGWVYSSAAPIQNVTGSGMADAVEAYDKLSVKRTKTESGLRIELGGYAGDASLMVRINEGELKEIKGGSAEHITGNLYLVKAEKSVLDIIVE